MNMKRVLTSRGFYIILFAIVTIIGTSVVIRNMSRSVIEQMNTIIDEEVPAFGEMVLLEEPEPIPEPPTVTNVTPPPAPPSQTVAASTVEAASPPPITSLRKPVDGEIINNFSGDELVFSNTMRDWRVHRGVDIAAPLGTQVRAAAAGVVEQVYVDDMLGVVVVIGHGNGLHTLYASLQSEEFISVGTRIQAGEIIGGVGGTAVSEIADGPHLHFEVHRNGTQIDPLSMLN